MSKGKRGNDVLYPGEELIRAGARAELRLLKQERSAEVRLEQAIAAMEKSQSRLDKAQERLDRSKDAVRAAAATLRDAQANRATGPVASTLN
jgi:hypothetical protein